MSPFVRALLLCGISILFAAADVRADSCPATVVFGNGIATWRKKAEDASKLLERALNTERSEVGAGDVPSDCFKIAYATREGGGLVDLLESASQLVLDKYRRFWKGLAGIDVLPDVVQEAMADAFGAVSDIEWISEEDLREHVSMYRQILNDRGKLVLVAHSQGNLFANQAFSRVVDVEQFPRERFSIISVATPDSYVADESRHITLYGDAILAVVFFNITQLPANTNTDGTPCKPLPFLEQLPGRNSVDCHSFENSYLKGSVSRTRILNRLMSLVPAVFEPPPPPPPPPPANQSPVAHFSMVSATGSSSSGGPALVAIVSPESGVAQVTFTDLSTDPDGDSIVSRRWTTDTGCTPTLPPPCVLSDGPSNFTWGFSPGTYTVVLTVRDNQGASADATARIEVRTEPAPGPGSVRVSAYVDGAPWTGAVDFAIVPTGVSPRNQTTVPTMITDVPSGLVSLTVAGGGPPDTYLAAISPARSTNVEPGLTAEFVLHFKSRRPLIPELVWESQNIGEYFAGLSVDSKGNLALCRWSETYDPLWDFYQKDVALLSLSAQGAERWAAPLPLAPIPPPAPVVTDTSWPLFGKTYDCVETLMVLPGVGERIYMSHPDGVFAFDSTGHLESGFPFILGPVGQVISEDVTRPLIATPDGGLLVRSVDVSWVTPISVTKLDPTGSKHWAFTDFDLKSDGCSSLPCQHHNMGLGPGGDLYLAWTRQESWASPFEARIVRLDLATGQPRCTIDGPFGFFLTGEVWTAMTVAEDSSNGSAQNGLVSFIDQSCTEKARIRTTSAGEQRLIALVDDVVITSYTADTAGALIGVTSTGVLWQNDQVIPSAKMFQAQGSVLYIAGRDRYDGKPKLFVIDVRSGEIVVTADITWEMGLGELRVASDGTVFILSARDSDSRTPAGSSSYDQIYRLR